MDLLAAVLAKLLHTQGQAVRPLHNALMTLQFCEIQFVMVGRGPFTDENVCELVTNFQTSLEQNIVSGATPLRINNAPVHVSQTYPSAVWSPEPRYIHRGHVNQADTGSKMAIWVSWAYGHQIMRIRIRQKRFEILKVHIKLFRLRQQFSFVRRPEHGRIGV